MVSQQVLRGASCVTPGRALAPNLSQFLLSSPALAVSRPASSLGDRVMRSAQALARVEAISLASRTNFASVVEGLSQDAQDAAVPLFLRCARQRAVRRNHASAGILSDANGDGQFLRSMPEITDGTGDGRLLVEFGSGSSLKTEILLDRIAERIAYVPIDVSRSGIGGCESAAGATLS